MLKIDLDFLLEFKTAIEQYEKDNYSNIITPLQFRIKSSYQYLEKLLRILYLTETVDDKIASEAVNFVKQWLFDNFKKNKDIRYNLQYLAYHNGCDQYSHTATSFIIDSFRQDGITVTDKISDNIKVELENQFSDSANQFEYTYEVYIENIAELVEDEQPKAILLLKELIEVNEAAGNRYGSVAKIIVDMLQKCAHDDRSSMIESIADDNDILERIGHLVPDTENSIETFLMMAMKYEAVNLASRVLEKLSPKLCRVIIQNFDMASLEKSNDIPFVIFCLPLLSDDQLLAYRYFQSIREPFTSMKEIIKSYIVHYSRAKYAGSEDESIRKIKDDYRRRVSFSTALIHSDLKSVSESSEIGDMLKDIMVVDDQYKTDLKKIDFPIDYCLYFQSVEILEFLLSQPGFKMDADSFIGRLVNIHYANDEIKCEFLIRILNEVTDKEILCLLVNKRYLQDLTDRDFITYMLKRFNATLSSVSLECQQLVFPSFIHNPILAEAFVETLADPSLLLRADSFGNTPLHSAAENHLYSFIKTVFEKFPNLDLSKLRNQSGLLPLHCLANIRWSFSYQQDVPIFMEIVSLLSQACGGINVFTNEESAYCFYPIHSLLARVIMHNNSVSDSLLKALIDAGADVNEVTADGFNILHLAACKSVSMLKHALEYCTDVNKQSNTAKHTPLHFAVKNGDLERVKVLIAHDAVLTDDADHMSPLDMLNKVSSLKSAVDVYEMKKVLREADPVKRHARVSAEQSELKQLNSELASLKTTVAQLKDELVKLQSSASADNVELKAAPGLGLF